MAHLLITDDAVTIDKSRRERFEAAQSRAFAPYRTALPRFAA
jgi:hypothetical protein